MMEEPGIGICLKAFPRHNCMIETSLRIFSPGDMTAPMSLANIILKQVDVTISAKKFWPILPDLGA
jgi:hypothetical protein